MILRSVLLSLFISTSLSLFPQAPGFAGKRALIAVEGYAFPSMRFIFTEERNFVLHSHLGVSTEYVLSRRFSTGILLNRLTTSFKYAYEGRVGTTGLSSTNIGIHIKGYTFLRRGNIAPIGPYQKIEIQYINYHITDRDQQFYPDGRKDLGEFREWVVTGTLGFQHVLPPRITYHWGIQGGWVLNIGQVFPFSDEGRYLKSRATSQLRDHFALNIHLGLGILLF